MSDPYWNHKIRVDQGELRFFIRWLAAMCVLLAIPAIFGGCAAHVEAHPPAAPSSQAELALQMEAAAERACERLCTDQVFSECVVEALESPTPEDCMHDKSRACVLNCAP